MPRMPQRCADSRASLRVPQLLVYGSCQSSGAAKCSLSERLMNGEITGGQVAHGRGVHPNGLLPDLSSPLLLYGGVALPLIISAAGTETRMLLDGDNAYVVQ